MPKFLKFGTYLACSWMWCIGAFFPLLLRRDYGDVVLLAFVVLNVAGAAWFGFHFKRGADERFMQGQRGMITVFSVVTMAYQVFFIAWLSALLGQPLLIAATLALTLLLVTAGRRLVEWSVPVFVLSLALFAWYAGNGLKGPAPAASPHALHVVLPLALGFLLSPYLDITFYRALRETDQPRLTFAVGFGLMFPALLLFVFFYTEDLSALFFEGKAYSPALYPVIAFMALQLAFTLAAHAQALRELNPGRARAIHGGLGLYALAVALAMHGWHGSHWPLPNQTLGEIIYKSFLFLYGVVFPLHLLIGERRGLFGLLLALAAPGYALGFFMAGGHTPALSVSMAVIAIGLLYRRRAAARA